MSIKREAFRGIRWTGLSSIVRAGLQLLQLVILTHYLLPSEFGLMALVFVVIGFSNLFMDMGISNAIIHKRNITHNQLSTLYWLNIISGLSLFAIIYLLSPYIADFYNEEELVILIRILSISFIISSFGNQYRKLMEKNLAFDTLSKIEIVSYTLSFSMAVSLAVKGFGIYSIVFATLTNISLLNLLFIFFGFKYNKPTIIFKIRDLRGIISFGLYQMGEKSINYFTTQFDIILIGKLLGSEALGIYSVAKNLTVKPGLVINPVITKVTFPIMSRVQEDIDALKNIYLKSISNLSAINFPIYLLIALLSEPIVVVLLNEKWIDAIPVIQTLSIVLAFRSTGNPIGSLQLARGRADMGFWWNFVLFLFSPLAIYTGSSYGLVGVSISLLIMQLLLIHPNWKFMVNPLCNASSGEYYRILFKPILLSVISAIAGLILNITVNLNGILMIIVTSFTVLVVYYLLSLKYNPIFVKNLYQLASIRSQ